MAEARLKNLGEASRTRPEYVTDVYHNDRVIRSQYPVHLSLTVLKFKTELLRSLPEEERTALATSHPTSYRIVLMLPNDELKPMDDAKQLSFYDKDLSKAEAVKLVLH